MSESMEDKIIKFINETGYPIELKVGSHFGNQGWDNVRYNKYYLDKDERKGREIDICAFKNLVREKNGTKLVVGIHIIAEVKYSIRNPWVVFMTKSHYFEAIEGCSRIHYSNLELDNLSEKEIEKESGLSKYENIGRSYCEVKEKCQKSYIFDSLTKVVKASEYFFERNKDAAECLEKNKEKHFYLFLPIIIVNGQLFEAFLDRKDELKIKETENTVISFNYKSPFYDRYNYAVEVVTLKSLPNFIKQKTKWLNSLFEILHSKQYRDGTN